MSRYDFFTYVLLHGCRKNGSHLKACLVCYSGYIVGPIKDISLKNSCICHYSYTIIYVLHPAAVLGCMEAQGKLEAATSGLLMLLD